MYVAVPPEVPAIVRSVHEWYAPDCCSGRDCVPIDNVKMVPGGYLLPDGEVIAYQSRVIRKSQDGRFHWCGIMEGGATRCLYVPPMGF